MLVVIGSEARRKPGPLTCPRRDDLVSALHVVGAAFALQHVEDRVLNELIRTLDAEGSSFPAADAVSLLGDLKGLKEHLYVEETRDLHGSINVERYLRLKAQVVDALREAAASRGDLVLAYLKGE